jgi:hypothetical protein
MSSGRRTIAPKTVEKTSTMTYTGYTITNANLNLFQNSLTLQIMFLGSNNIPIDYKNLIISGQNFLNWKAASNDNILNTIIETEFQLTPATQ